MILKNNPLLRRPWPCMLVCLIVLGIAACKPRTPLNVTPMNHYFYTDGSGNQYTLSPDSLVYKPMTPERSSSGTYSGGVPKSVPIQPTAYETLQARFEAALDDREKQIDHRPMGCGTVSVETAHKRKTVFLEMHADSKSALETALKNALK